jgi:hypothetical protein
MLPNIPPKLFSLSAVAVGYLLIDDMTANEQNALGNWLMLVAQVLSTNAYYKALMKERGLDTDKFTESGKNNAYSFGNNRYKFNNSNELEDTITMLKKMVSAIEKEIIDLKGKI